MVIAHGPISYIANELIQKKRISKLKLHEQIFMAVMSLFFGILPDFDVFFLSGKKLPTFIHHDIIFHTPIYYIGIWILLKVLVKPLYTILNKKVSNVLDKNILNMLADAFLIGTISHMIADLFVGSIMFFYPISNIKIYVLKYLFEPNLFARYIYSPLFAIEMIVLAVFLYKVYRKFFRQYQFAKILLKSLTIISFIYLPFTIYFSVNTYNRSYMYDENGSVNYDIDRDTLNDSMDMDIGNDGRGNMEKADQTKLLDSTLDIINSRKLTSQDRGTLMSKVRYQFGAFDSYRLISQAYFNTGMPIEPVLKDFSFKKYGFTSYEEEFKYPNLLFEYLDSNNQLMELNLESISNLPASRIVFFKDKQDDIINLGITIEGNYLTIVLDDDQYLEMHSYKSVREYYSTEIEKIYIQR